jgi:hypothetical protein
MLRRIAVAVVLVALVGVCGCEGDDAVAPQAASTTAPGAPANPLDTRAMKAPPTNPLARPTGAETNPKQDQPKPTTGTPDQAPFHGTFHTTYQGSESIIRIEQSGQNVAGKIDLAVLSGRVEGDSAKGEVKNPDTGEVGGTFVMKRKGQDLEFHLTLRDPNSGQTVPLPAFTYKKGDPPAQPVKLDPGLVGRWRYTWTQTSGDFTAAVDTWLILNGDGTYEYGYSKGGAGGAAGSVVTDRGDATTGKWRAQDRLLQYQENGTGPWQTFARYYVEGDTMMLTYDDGSKKIWYRR